MKLTNQDFSIRTKNREELDPDCYKAKECEEKNRQREEELESIIEFIDRDYQLKHNQRIPNNIKKGLKLVLSENATYDRIAKELGKTKVYTNKLFLDFLENLNQVVSGETVTKTNLQKRMIEHHKNNQEKNKRFGLAYIYSKETQQKTLLETRNEKGLMLFIQLGSNATSKIEKSEENPTIEIDENSCKIINGIEAIAASIAFLTRKRGCVREGELLEIPFNVKLVEKNEIK